MKKLYLLRHAEAVSADEIEDFDRPLSQKGRDDIKLTVKQCSQKRIFPDRIVSSPANRAILSATAVAEELNFPAKLVQKESLFYEATDLNALFDYLRNMDKATNSLFVVGHNPLLSRVASLLCSSFTVEMKKGALLALNLNIHEWSKLTKFSGEMDFYYYPR